MEGAAPTAPSTGAPSATPSSSSTPSSPNTGGAQASAGASGIPETTRNPAPAETREYKINGKMVKMTQKEADEYVSMSYAAQERFNEAAKLRREVEQREAQYSKEPLKAFLDYAQRAKLTPEQTRQALEDYYSKQYIEPEMLTAEQRKLKELEEWKTQREKEDQERFMTEQQKYERQMTEQEIQNATNEILAALESAQLPQKNKFLVQRMAFYMHQNSQNGWNAPKEMVLKQVMNEHKSIVGDFLKDATMDQIVNYAGQEFVDRILKDSLEKIRQKRNIREEPFTKTDSSRNHAGTGKIDMADVNRRLREMRLGKY